ncbi:MAG: hypothetical protein QM783_15245 [Phycisphaerales bacterium]
MPKARISGVTPMSRMIALQLGLAMMLPFPRGGRASELISGTTSGTLGTMRKAEELSMTTTPASAAAGANCLLGPEPAESRAQSTPLCQPSISGSTMSSPPL